MAKQQKRGVCCACCYAKRQPIDEPETEIDVNTVATLTGEPSGDTQNHNDPKKPETQEKKKGSSCLQCCKTFTTFLFSNIGLTSLVVAYSILGGFIFMELESPHEITARESVSSRRRYHAQRLWNRTLEDNILFEQNWTESALKILLDFQRDIINATKKQGWDGTEGDGGLQWSFPGSLLYSITVITTIGYGHIAPKTEYGKFVTIVYALVGIPMTLLCLANLGSFLGNCFRFLYKHLCRMLTWLCCPPKRKPKKDKVAVRQDKRSEEWDLLHRKGDNSKTKSKQDVSVVIEEAAKTDKKSEPTRVPIFVSLMVIVLYIFGGALMFSIWEGWDYLVGSYFCFITLSTIGFGDYVPGSISAAGDSSSNQKLIICSFYLFFGLSLLAMCFDLMQEEVRAKCRWLGTKFGFIDKK